MSMNTERIDWRERLYHLKEENEYLKEFISLIAEDIEEDIFGYLPEYAGEAEVKARGMWEEVKDIINA